MNRFKVNRLEFGYFDRPETEENERRVEVPMGRVALELMKRYAPVVEVGDVLHQFCPDLDHRVIDLYEKPRPGLENKNFLECDVRGCNLLSISTFEHFGIEEFGHSALVGPQMFQDAIRKTVEECDFFFITVPREFRQDVDDYLWLHAADRQMILLNRQHDNSWRQATVQEFNFPTFHGVCFHIAVMTNIPEFLP